MSSTESNLPALIAKMGTSGLGSEIELTILKIAAGDPDAVSEMDFAKALLTVSADEYAHPDASHIGAQACTHIEYILKHAQWNEQIFTNICRFLAQAGTGSSAPPMALPLILQQLPAAVGSAKASPGEEWEDRNWGGYNMSESEICVDAMTNALKTLCAAPYTEASWIILLEGLITLELPSLKSIPIGEYTGLGFAYKHMDIYSLLRRGLLNIDDRVLHEALRLKGPNTALHAACERLRSHHTPTPPTTLPSPQPTVVPINHKATPLESWFKTRFDAQSIHLEVHPPGRPGWEAHLDWADIIRICFLTQDLLCSDEIYIFTNQRPESYLIPTEASGATALWGEIIRRGLFDAQLAIDAATGAGGLYCWPPDEN